MRSIPIFKDLSESDLALIGNLAVEKPVPKGTVIFTEGQVGDSLYLIASGRVKVFIGDEDGREIILKILNVGDFFGEMALIDNQPRSASVSTLEPSTFRILSKQAFAPLPLWSSTQNAFQLRDVFDERPPTGKDARRGVVFEPIRQRTVLAVEVTGGKTRARIPSNPGDKSSVRNTVDDESAAEVLFMYPDGSMEVKTSARDKADTDRRAREDVWKKWIADTESGAAPKAGTGTGTGKVPNEF